MNTIGDRIKAKRKELGLTQLDLAEKLNVTDRAVSKWELNDGNPDFSLLPTLAETLGVSLDYLITGKIVEPVINLDDMDSQKRAEYLAKKDDAENFVKYGYVDLDILLDAKAKKEINRRSTNNDRCYEKIRGLIIENKSYKIFSLLLDKFVDFCNDRHNERYLQNVFSGAYFVETILDDFVQMSAILGRVDVLELIKFKWFNGSSILQLKEKFKPFSVINATLDEILSNPNVPSCIVDYICEPLFLLVLRRSEMFGFTTQIPIVGTQFDYVLLHFYKSNNLQRINQVIDYLYDNLRKNTSGYRSYSTADDIRSGYRNVTKTYKNGICYSHRGADSYDYYTYYCAVPIIEKALSAAKSDHNVEMVKIFNDYNREVGEILQEKVGYLNDEDIKELNVKANPNASNDDIIIAENTRMRLMNYKGVGMPFVGADDVDKLKKSISEAKRIYDHIISKGFIHYMELVETHVGEKDYKALFEFANDCELKSLEDAALGMNDDEIIDAAASFFLPPEKIVTQYLEMQNVLLAAGEGNGYIHFNHFAYSRSDFQKKMDEILLRYNKEISGRNDKLSRMIERQNNIIPLRDLLLKAVELKVEDLKELPFAKYCQELKLCIYQAYVAKTEGRIESITREKERKAEYDAVASEITVDYLRTESQKGNIENAIIKLCVLLEAKLKYCCRYEGDLFNMIDTFVTVKYTPGELHNCWDDEDNNYYTYQREDEETKQENERKAHKTQLLHKLRMKRNQLVHAGGEKTDFSKDDLDECIAIVEAI